MNKRVINSMVALLVVSNMYYINNNYKMNKRLEVYKQEANNSIDQYKQQIAKLNTLLNTKNVELKNIKEKLNSKEQYITSKEKEINELRENAERISRGGSIAESKEITVHITYYTNQNSSLEGGEFDRVGKPLTSYEENICAMPSDVPYNSILSIDDMGDYKVVDTGEAMRWLNEEKMECLIDIFIPNVTTEWLNSNTQKKTKKAILYLK